MHCGNDAHGVSPPPLCAPPYNAIPREQVLQNYRTAQGRYGGTGTVPSFTSNVYFLS